MRRRGGTRTTRAFGHVEHGRDFIEGEGSERAGFGVGVGEYPRQQRRARARPAYVAQPPSTVMYTETGVSHAPTAATSLSSRPAQAASRLPGGLG